MITKGCLATGRDSEKRHKAQHADSQKCHVWPSSRPAGIFMWGLCRIAWVSQNASIQKEGVTGRLIFHFLSSFYPNVVPRLTFASIIMKLNNAKARFSEPRALINGHLSAFFPPLVVGCFLDAPVCFGEQKVLKGNEALIGPFKKWEEKVWVSWSICAFSFGKAGRLFFPTDLVFDRYGNKGTVSSPHRTHCDIIKKQKTSNDLKPFWEIYWPSSGSRPRWILLSQWLVNFTCSSVFVSWYFWLITLHLCATSNLASQIPHAPNCGSV